MLEVSIAAAHSSPNIANKKNILFVVLLKDNLHPFTVLDYGYCQKQGIDDRAVRLVKQVTEEI